MFQQHYYPDHHSATDPTPHMMHPFYTLGSPYPLYPTFTHSFYDRRPPHGPTHGPPPPPPPPSQSQPSRRRSSIQANTKPTGAGPKSKPAPASARHAAPDWHSLYGSHPHPMKSFFHHLYHDSHPYPYPYHDPSHHDDDEDDEEPYDTNYPQQQHHDDYDHESSEMRPHLHPHPHPHPHHPQRRQPNFSGSYTHDQSYPYQARMRPPQRNLRRPYRYPEYPTRTTTYHEDGHGMGLPPFQQECDEREMYPNHVETHIPTYPRQQGWNDEQEELGNNDEYNSASQHRQVPIRVIPVTLTNNMPLRRRFLITHKPSRPMDSSDSEWDDPSSCTSYQYDPHELSSMLQANPDAIRPLLLQLLPLYEPYLRQALKHDEKDKQKEKDEDKGASPDKEQKSTNANAKTSTNNITANTNTNTNKTGTKTNTTPTSTSKPQAAPSSSGPTKATNSVFSKVTEPEIKKMTPPTTRMRIIHPVQEKESHLSQSETYKVPSPSPEENQEPLPPPARPRQLYSYIAHHETDGKKDKVEKPKQDKKKEEIKSTNTNTTSQSNVDIKEPSTSRDIPIRGPAAAAASSTAPTPAPHHAPASAPAPAPTPSTTRDIPITERHESKSSSETSSTTLRHINIQEKKHEPVEIPKKEQSKVEQAPTATPQPSPAPAPAAAAAKPPTPAAAPAAAPAAPTPSASSSTLVQPTPHIRRHSPTVEIEDVPATPAHRASSPVHRHTLSHDSLNPPKSTPTPTPTTTTPSATTEKEDEKVDTKQEAETSTQEQTAQKNKTPKPTVETKKEAETHVNTDQPMNLDTPSGISNISPVSDSSSTTTGMSSIQQAPDQQDVQVNVDDTTTHESPIHSPASSTYSSIMHSCSGSPDVSTPPSPEQHHHRMDSQDQDWHFTSPVMKTNTLKRNEKQVDMNMTSEEKEYVITITLPEHITKHDIRLDTDTSSLTVESIDDPPMFPSRSIALPSDADLNQLSAKSELIDDFHTIIVKIPKRITNKRPIRIE